MNQGKSRLTRPLREVDKAFIQLVMLKLGILPMDRIDLDMRRALQQMSPEEARACKRKFRKLWRRALKEKLSKNSSHTGKTRVARELGNGQKIPNRIERINRKKAVFDAVWEEHIQPLINNFENPPNTKKNEGNHMT